MHTIYSDGTNSVEEIFQQAKQLGLSQIAITDHNTLEGALIAKSISDIDFVVGVELSVGYKGKEVHLLGYFPKQSDYKHTKFVIGEGEAYKKIAIMEMIERLNEQGIDIDFIELAQHAKGIINRVHIAKALIRHGYTKTVNEGFEKYVGEHCPAYVERKTIPLQEAALAIQQDGGLAVIAHPYEYDDVGDIDDFLYDIIPLIDGIECFHPTAFKGKASHLVEIANDNNKIITGGSDYHGENKENIYMNMMQVDDKYRIGD